MRRLPFNRGRFLSVACASGGAQATLNDFHVWPSRLTAPTRTTHTTPSVRFAFHRTSTSARPRRSSERAARRMATRSDRVAPPSGFGVSVSFAKISHSRLPRPRDIEVALLLDKDAAQIVGFMSDASLTAFYTALSPKKTSATSSPHVPGGDFTRRASDTLRRLCIARRAQPCRSARRSRDVGNAQRVQRSALRLRLGGRDPPQRSPGRPFHGEYSCSAAAAR
jgi:hypothetical protein